MSASPWLFCSNEIKSVKAADAIRANSNCLSGFFNSPLATRASYSCLIWVSCEDACSSWAFPESYWFHASCNWRSPSAICAFPSLMICSDCASCSFDWASARQPESNCCFAEFNWNWADAKPAAAVASPISSCFSPSSNSACPCSSCTLPSSNCCLASLSCVWASFCPSS